MSLTILFQLPVDTGKAKIRTDLDNANLWDFYLLAGRRNSDWAVVATLRSGFGSLCIFNLILHLLLHFERERYTKFLMN